LRTHVGRDPPYESLQVLHDAVDDDLVLGVVIEQLAGALRKLLFMAAYLTPACWACVALDHVNLFFCKSITGTCRKWVKPTSSVISSMHATATISCAIKESLVGIQTWMQEIEARRSVVPVIVLRPVARVVYHPSSQELNSTSDKLPSSFDFVT
jgi:hypothetical protein